MLKRNLFISFVLLFSITYAQDAKLASQYFREGDFEKAASIYRDLYKEKPHNTQTFKYLLKCYLADEEFDKAKELITSRQEKYTNQHFLLVELGYVYQLQHLQEQAESYYQQALETVIENPSKSYQTAKSFQDNHILDYALTSYQTMMKANSRSNYYYQVAAIYGEQGKLEKMFDTYLDMIDGIHGRSTNIRRFIGRFITDDSQNSTNIIFRKLLVRRLQNNPQDEWNKLLSWLYIQQKDYDKALRQEIAIHKRSHTDLEGVIDVGTVAFEMEHYATTKAAFDYVKDHTNDMSLLLYSQYFLLESARKLNPNILELEDEYNKQLNRFGWTSNTTDLQVSYADFLTFDANKPQEAIKVLKTALENRLDPYQKAKIKIQLGDVLVFTGKYNQALITFSQVQTKLKNHALAQEARYKVARTSYFKGDFEWANIQLKVLKRGTSNLIANDALDLSLLIDDNRGQDSIPAALKLYAKADLLQYQNKNQEAIDTLSQVLVKYKGQPVEDEALFLQAKLYEKQGKYEQAIQNYARILDLKDNDILIDDALFFIAKLYDEKQNEPEKAKEYYKQIVFEQASSIYLVPARNRYRQLRGDEVLP